MFNMANNTLYIAIYLGVMACIAIAWLLFNRQKKEVVPDELESADQKSMELIQQAMQKAQQILADSQTQSLTITSANKLKLDEFEKAAEKNLTGENEAAKEIFDEKLKEFTTQVTQAQQEYLNYLTSLKSKMDESQQASADLIKQQINVVFEKFEQNMADFLTQTEQRSVSSIDLEMKAARQLIDTYKEQQLKLIDENIIAMLERTLSLVLTKKLDFKDQQELVYEGLEQAKVEKFIV